MIIKIKVKPSSDLSEIRDLGDGYYEAYIRANPQNNEANVELIKILSKKFGVDWRRVKIRSGLTSQHKIVEVDF